MDIKNVKIGMKVKLLGKHALGDNFDDIDDWYGEWNDDNSIKNFRTQGYGYVIKIEDDGYIWVNGCEDGWGWCFIASDLEPYEEITEQNANESAMQKSPKEWLLTPFAIFTVKDGDECITLRNNTACVINDGTKWSEDLNEEYNEDLIYIDECDGNDIMQITFNGKVVWKRREYMTLTDAIKTGKNFKHKDWIGFYSPDYVLKWLIGDSNLINLFTDKVWEVE